MTQKLRINMDELLKQQPKWPTNRIQPEFWEALGRAVGSFGFLEEVLARAIFAISGTKVITSIEKADEEFHAWNAYLLKALSDSFGGLIDKYEKEIKVNSKFSTESSVMLIKDLKELKEWRNILCHSSWRSPNSKGESVPLFVKKNGEYLDTPVDVASIEQVMKKTVELACEVMNSVTTHGYVFPGTIEPK